MAWLLTREHSSDTYKQVLNAVDSEIDDDDDVDEVDGTLISHRLLPTVSSAAAAE